MTTTVFKNQKCRMCGTSSRFEVIASTNEFGTPDLDLRPAEMKRSTMTFWCQACPNCGYTYGQIEEGSLSSSEFETLKSTNKWYEMNAICSDSTLSRNFTRYALILERENDNKLDIAGQYLCAAWAADDKNDENLAKELRRQAAKYYESHYEGLSKDDLDDSPFLLLDVLRRSGDFEKCEKLIAKLERVILEGILPDLLAFQKKLVAKRDIRSHAISEINQT